MAKDLNLKRMTEISSTSENKHMLRIIISQIIETNQMIKVEIGKWLSQSLRKAKIKID